MARSLAPYEYTGYPGGGLGPHPVCLPPPRFGSVRPWQLARWRMHAGKRAPPVEAVPEFQSCTFWGCTFPPCARWPERDQYQRVWLAPAPARGTPNVPSIPWPRFAGPPAEHVPWPGSQPVQQPTAKRLATRPKYKSSYIVGSVARPSDKAASRLEFQLCGPAKAPPWQQLRVGQEGQRHIHNN